MIKRTLAEKLEKATSQFPVVTLTGPRQSGKTTLVKAVFPDYEYVSLEIPDQRRFALEDPRGFLAQFEKPVILDEVQRTPELFSYIQALVDDHPEWTGRFIMTGSQNFLLLQSISQSLAGRCAVLHLMPFSLSEIEGRQPIIIENLGKLPSRKLNPPTRTLFKTLFTGFYPRIHDKKLPPQDWLAGYYQTYLERDVRNVLKIGDLETFDRFMRLCAGRNGQLLNFSGLASDCGVSHTTVSRWISLLEASFIVTLLRPHRMNFGKRFIKSPKIYFIDTGLLCYLLQIGSPNELFTRSERGAVFENFIVSELYKNFMNRGAQPTVYFWRDVAGHEVDLVIDLGSELIPCEIKSGKTIAADFFDNLKYWRNLFEKDAPNGVLIYGGDSFSRRSGTLVRPWFAV